MKRIITSLMILSLFSVSQLLVPMAADSDDDTDILSDSEQNNQNKSANSRASAKVDSLLKEAQKKYSQALLVAAKEGLDDKIKSILDLKADIEIQNSEGKRPLHLAAFAGHKKTMEVLIACKADVIARDYVAETPLHNAVNRGHVDCAQYLLDNNASIEATNETDETPLHQITDSACLALLLARGANINAVDDVGDTLIHNLVYTKKVGLLKALLAYDPSVNIANQRGFTPLHCAAQKGFQKCLELLLENRANVDVKDTGDGWTALHWAGNSNKTACVESLLKYRANTTLCDRLDRTAKHRALFYGNKALAALIEKHEQAELQVLKKDSNKWSLYRHVPYLPEVAANLIAQYCFYPKADEIADKKHQMLLAAQKASEEAAKPVVKRQRIDRKKGNDDDNKLFDIMSLGGKAEKL
ncbi:MAG: ankyrin repeat domain-containing protein [Candidatus Dependentiae bacterium]|nr:ankyrin repeat domain-containing protein [Candidatus Dependentiae bacterium]